MKNKLVAAFTLALLITPALWAQTIRSTRLSQIQFTELTTAQEAGMTLAEGSFWYNSDLKCYRYRSATTTICVAGDLIQWKNLEGIYNVKGYGAVGDGVADDTAEIQAAIDAACALGGGTVYLPPGDYLISASIQLCAQLTLRGAGGTGEGAGGSSTSVTRIFANLTNDSLIEVPDVAGEESGIQILDLHVNNTAVTNVGAIGIDFIGVVFSKIENVRIQRVETGIRIGGDSRCACYNHFYDVQIVSVDTGVLFSTTANQNTWIGGQVNTVSSGGKGFDFNGGGSNALYHPDVETFTGAIAFHVQINKQTIHDPYCEIGLTCIQVEVGGAAYISNPVDAGGLTNLIVNNTTPDGNGVLVVDDAIPSWNFITEKIQFRNPPNGASLAWITRDLGGGPFLEFKNADFTETFFAIRTDIGTLLRFYTAADTRIGALHESSGRIACCADAGTDAKFEVTGGVYPDGGGWKHKRTSTGSISASSSAAVVVMWDTAFPNASYTVTCSVVEADTDTATLQVDHIEAVVAASVTVRVENEDAGAARTGTLHCVAMHD